MLNVDDGFVSCFVAFHATSFLSAHTRCTHYAPIVIATMLTRLHYTPATIFADTMRAKKKKTQKKARHEFIDNLSAVLD